LFRIAHNGNWIKQRETRGLEGKGKHILKLYRFLVLHYYHHHLHYHFPMHGFYNYIPESHYVPRVYSVAAILLWLFMVPITLVSVLNLLYFYISTFRSMCAVPNMAVFCSSLTSCFLVCCSRVFWMTLKQTQSPYYYWYHLHFYIPHALYFYCKVFKI